MFLTAERARSSGLQSSRARYHQKGFTAKSLSGGTLNPVSRPVSYSPSSTAFSASGPDAASSWYLQQGSDGPSCLNKTDDEHTREAARP
jgi:hypothetical protein